MSFIDSSNILPIGTIVQVKQSKKEMMITGYLYESKEDNTIYDYIGCYYPVGILNKWHNYLFNNEDIKMIIAKGYANETTEKFNEELLKVANQNND